MLQSKQVFLCLSILFYAFATTSQESAQPVSRAGESSAIHQELHAEVNVVASGLTLSQQALIDARSLKDLNKHYKPSWVRSFHSVTVSSTHDGKTRSAIGKNDALTTEQKQQMMEADAGTPISITMKYIPENTLKHNEMKEWDFKFIVNPISDAQYPGGKPQLKAYLQEHIINKIPASSFEEFELMAVKFTVDRQGNIIDVSLYDSKNEEVDELLITSVRNMPQWRPATYSTTHPVDQHFVLTVGNMKSCIVNLLNIRDNKF